MVLSKRGSGEGVRWRCHNSKGNNVPDTQWVGARGLGSLLKEPFPVPYNCGMYHKTFPHLKKNLFK